MSLSVIGQILVSLLQPFIANRTSKIQSLTSKGKWYRIDTEENPADFQSRRVNLLDLMENKCWWHGTSWLISDQTQWPIKQLIFNSDPPLMKKKLKTFSISETEQSIFKRYSTLAKLQTLISNCYRFMNNSRVKSSSKTDGPLKMHELSRSMEYLFTQSQSKTFLVDIVFGMANL